MEIWPVDIYFFLSYIFCFSTCILWESWYEHCQFDLPKLRMCIHFYSAEVWLQLSCGHCSRNQNEPQHLFPWSNRHEGTAETIFIVLLKFNKEEKCFGFSSDPYHHSAWRIHLLKHSAEPCLVKAVDYCFLCNSKIAAISASHMLPHSIALAALVLFAST